MSKATTGTGSPNQFPMLTGPEAPLFHGRARGFSCGCLSGRPLFGGVRGLLLTAYPELNVVNWLQFSGKRFGLERRCAR